MQYLYGLPYESRTSIRQMLALLFPIKQLGEDQHWPSQSNLARLVSIWPRLPDCPRLESAIWHLSVLPDWVQCGIRNPSSSLPDWSFPDCKLFFPQSQIGRNSRLVPNGTCQIRARLLWLGQQNAVVLATKLVGSNIVHRINLRFRVI